jgi:hypothetical protein
MYGQLLNQNFPTKINPVAFIMGCNGKEIAVGPTDTNDHKLFSVHDVVIGSLRPRSRDCRVLLELSPNR